MIDAAPPTKVVLPEYGRRLVPCARPSDEDLRIAEALNAARDEAKLHVTWLVDGQAEIVASSWVGIVRFSTLDIRVVPKLVGGELNVLRMLSYASGIDVLRRLPNFRSIPPEGEDLLELVCMLLVEETEAILRDGLLSDYRFVEEPLSILRGRLRLREQYVRRFGRLDQLECQFDEFDSDIPDNQLLSAAISAGWQLARDHDLLLRLNRVGAILSEACAPPVTDPTWYREHISYGRRNAHYQTAHELATLLLSHLGFADVFQSRTAKVRTFLLDMNALFERFISQLVTNALTGSALRVVAQKPLRAVIRNDATGRTYSSVRPDLVILNDLRVSQVPIDIKYKRYEQGKVPTNDIYQTFLYAYALGSHDDRRAGIVYPSTDVPRTTALSVHAVDGEVGAHIAAAGIDVPAMLQALYGSKSEQSLALQQVRAVVLGLCAFAFDRAVR